MKSIPKFWKNICKWYGCSCINIIFQDFRLIWFLVLCQVDNLIEAQVNEVQDATQHVLVEEYISQVELFKCDNIVTCLRLLDKFKVVRLILFCKFQKQSSWIL